MGRMMTTFLTQDLHLSGVPESGMISATATAGTPVLNTGSCSANLVCAMCSFESTFSKNPSSYCTVIILPINMKLLPLELRIHLRGHLVPSSPLSFLPSSSLSVSPSPLPSCLSFSCPLSLSPLFSSSLLHLVSLRDPGGLAPAPSTSSAKATGTNTSGFLGCGFHGNSASLASVVSALARLPWRLTSLKSDLWDCFS